MNELNGFGDDMSAINLTINDKAITAQEGQTILEVALENGVHVPRLCFDPRVSPSGSCRLCVVEIGEGPGARLVTACTFPVHEGLKVRTASTRVLRARRMIRLVADQQDLCWRSFARFSGRKRQSRNGD